MLAKYKAKIAIILGILIVVALLTAWYMGYLTPAQARIVATPGAGTVQDYLLSLVELKYNVTFERIFITPPTGMEPALLRGEISGFIAWEPFPAKSVYDGAGRILLTSRDIWPNHPCCVLAVSSRFLENYPNVVKNIVNIHKNATNFINENPAEAKSIAASYTGQVEDVAESAMERVIFDYRPNKDGIKEILQYLITAGKIPSGNAPPDIDAFLDNFIKTEYMGTQVQTPTKVRLAYLTADIHHLALFTAREKDWYSSTGVEFEFKEYPNGPAEMMAFRAGEIDIGYLGIVPATLFKINEKVNITVVAAANMEGSALVVNQKIVSVEELGRKIEIIVGVDAAQNYLPSPLKNKKDFLTHYNRRKCCTMDTF